MNKSTKLRIIGMTLLIVLFISLISVAIVIENNSKTIVIGDDVELDNGIHELPKNVIFAVSNTEPINAPFEEKGVILTCTVKPDNATNKTINFKIEWVNPESDWANGKNISSYLTLEPVLNEFTAQLICKAPFGEQAKITATSESNTDKFATCIVNFKNRLLDLKLNVYDVYNGKNEFLGTADREMWHPSDSAVNSHFASVLLPYYFNMNTTENTDKVLCRFVFEPVWGIGTISDEIVVSVENMEFKYAESIMIKWRAYKKDIDFSNVGLNMKEEGGTYNDGYNYETWWFVYMHLGYYISTAEDVCIWNSYMNEVVSAGQCVFFMTFKNIKVDGQLYKSNSTYCVGLTSEALKVAVESVAIDNGDIAI